MSRWHAPVLSCLVRHQQLGVWRSELCCSGHKLRRVGCWSPCRSGKFTYDRFENAKLCHKSGVFRHADHGTFARRNGLSRDPTLQQVASARTWVYIAAVGCQDEVGGRLREPRCRLRPVLGSPVKCRHLSTPWRRGVAAGGQRPVNMISACFSAVSGASPWRFYGAFEVAAGTPTLECQGSKFLVRTVGAQSCLYFLHFDPQASIPKLPSPSFHPHMIMTLPPSITATPPRTVAARCTSLSPGVGRAGEPIAGGVAAQQAQQWPPVRQHHARPQPRRQQTHEADAGAKFYAALACTYFECISVIPIKYWRRRQPSKPDPRTQLHTALACEEELIGFRVPGNSCTLLPRSILPRGQQPHEPTPAASSAQRLLVPILLAEFAAGSTPIEQPPLAIVRSMSYDRETSAQHP